MEKKYMVTLLLALLSCMAMVVVNGSSGKEKFYIIAHMANNEEVAGWALDTGANALEIDTSFSNDGIPYTAYHGLPCDCTCFILYGVCYFNPCYYERPIIGLINYIMKHARRNKLALIYLDSKLWYVAPNKYDRAGKEMISLVEKVLFKKGYKGKVLIGGGNKTYLNSLIKYATQSTYESQIYISYDVTENHAKALNYTLKLKYTNKMFSVGLSACSSANYYQETIAAYAYRKFGYLNEVIAWTLDRQSTFYEYYKRGATGIITNDVEGLVSWTKKRDISLYTPDDN